jgi:outer membrane protein, multidrug efflux system
MIRRDLAALLGAALLAGCMSVGPDYVRPDADAPSQFPGEYASDPIPEHWWKIYADPTLDAMVEEALAHNADLRLAIARVDEARAAVGISRADQYPGVSAAGSAARNRASQDSAAGVPPGVDPVSNNYRATLGVAWEIDLWGRYRRASEAARAELLSAQANREAVRLALVGEVANGYFRLRALDAQLAVTERTVSTRLASTALQRLRFEAGVASEFDLRQVEAQAAQAQALQPSLERQIAQQENALSVLLGRSPRQIVGQPVDRGAAIEAIAAPPAVPSGLPSDLLQRRPDLRRAEQQLIAANARIGVARAAYYPSISLSGFLGGESSTLADLFSAPARIWQFSASAAQTVFDAGRTGAQVEAAQARERQALAQYQLAVQNAFRETLDALIAKRKAREVFEAEQRRADALGLSLALAQLRYDNGVSSLLDVLDAERGLLDAELNRIEAQRAQLAATADLFKALGGGWHDAPRTAEAAGN